MKAGVKTTMFEYKNYFDRYCREHTLDLQLSFDMPAGYEEANGSFDPASKTVFINAERLQPVSDAEKAFFLFHELRHASQYLSPDEFSAAIRRSTQYIMMYDGTCYKQVDGNYRKCSLQGSEEYLANLYLGQPHEVDANRYAYEQAKKIFGASEALEKLFRFWMPRQDVPAETYEALFSWIDQNIQ